MEHPLGYDRSDSLIRGEEREGLLQLLRETVRRDCTCHPWDGFHAVDCPALPAGNRLLELTAVHVAR